MTGKRTTRTTIAGGCPPYQQDPPGLPRPDVIRGWVVFHDDEVAGPGNPRADILVDLKRRSPYHAYETVQTVRTRSVDGGMPQFQFTLYQPGDYIVCVHTEQAALLGYRSPAPFTVVSLTCGVTTEVEFHLQPRP